MLFSSFSPSTVSMMAAPLLGRQRAERFIDLCTAGADHPPRVAEKRRAVGPTRRHDPATRRSITNGASIDRAIMILLVSARSTDKRHTIHQAILRSSQGVFARISGNILDRGLFSCSLYDAHALEAPCASH
jgi:hypothetical protein